MSSKDEAAAFVPGAIAGDQRRATAISALTALVLDLDKGENLDVIRSNVRAAGVLAIVYSTHSHMSSTTEIKIDDYREFTGELTPTAAGLRCYLADKKGIDPEFLESVDVQESYRDTADGAVCVAGHAPIPKYRVVLPLEKPFARREFVENGMTQRDFEAAWKAKYAAFANALGVRWDSACADVARAFFYPTCRPDAPRVAEKIDGKLLKLEAVPVEPQAKPATSRSTGITRQRQNTGKPAGDNGLKTWIAEYGATFEIEAALRSRGPADIFQGRADWKAGRPHCLPIRGHAHHRRWDRDFCRQRPRE